MKKDDEIKLPKHLESPDFLFKKSRADEALEAAIVAAIKETYIPKGARKILNKKKI